MMDLAKLREPFPADDVEWRVCRAGMGSKGIYCVVVAYITARAIQQRLDDVCGPANWRIEEPRIIDCGRPAIAAGISILVRVTTTSTLAWITKWDVAEPTNIEPAKGGFSSAMKRAGCQWGIGRYLWYLEEEFAEVVDEVPPSNARKNWNYAELSPKQGGASYWWRTPSLPGWALPPEDGEDLAIEDLNDLKKRWAQKFASADAGREELQAGFRRFVTATVGDFPISDHTCWTIEAIDRCSRRIEETTDPDGISPDVPFDGGVA